MGKMKQIQLNKATITAQCRANRGDGGAFDEACERLRISYEQAMRAPDINFHLVLVMEAPRPERTDWDSDDPDIHGN